MPRFTGLALLAASAITCSSFAPTTTGFQLGSGGRVMWENNCDFTGNDYRSLRGIPAMCGDVCADDSTCTHWSWTNYNSGTCWLKKGARSAKVSKWATNCGYVTSRNVRVQTQGIQASAIVASSSGLSSSEMSEMLSRINNYRVQNGLGALTMDNRLTVAAALHSQDQASHCEMTHTGSDGSRLGDRIKAQGYSFAMAAENVAAGQTSVEQVMTSWWNSPGHRANILAKDATNVGFAKVINGGCDSYDTYWTQDFGRQG
ncbi:uncharacterized protein KRP23_10466 [Phytophthora ramorum]|uniref:SCP domain-containing protein n=1 Tax=Phytophthora ramorum TaxID=164328 RepID=H3GT31_PHYRM|nr:hypothetical protein KRP23_10466 [Phytophthora ramorum]